MKENDLFFNKDLNTLVENKNIKMLTESLNMANLKNVTNQFIANHGGDAQQPKPNS